ncbi:RNA polymerase sigma factor [Herbiconiux daphne]|uniref:RNA polymerase subunit sigma-70 n=1 Tax=Herbiconiux daphne TaxID=2970914 RepID=A0ABT2H3Y6_9MICO|nr:DUF6596 domain-containing protein [Herbiconiux daphne]MCS5734643.1 RNA polymerase subunit sigma-70 [Herbiconiux daphne]
MARTRMIPPAPSTGPAASPTTGGPAAAKRDTTAATAHLNAPDASATTRRDAGDAAAVTAEQVARTAYGRLLALLAAPTRDIVAAEDALADAFERALRGWPESGVPDNPEGWLLTVARNRQRDELGSAAHRTSVPLDLLIESSGPTESTRDAGGGRAQHPTTVDDPFAVTLAHDHAPDLEAIPDKRLELLFVCAHPAIDPAVRTPLMLQTVLGFDAQQIATAFVVPAPAMAQRLVRAKRRIRSAGIPFTVPDRTAMPGRLAPVLEAVYGAYAIDWQRVSGETLRESLSAEALYLAETLADLLPTEPEAHGLAALLCLSIARTGARTTPEGDWIPLDAQDPTLWNHALIARGESHLRRAHALATREGTAEPIPFGRFQLEAAMQSVHCARASTGDTDWRTLRTLNEALVRVAPTLGAHVSLAATIAEVDGPEAGLAYLDHLATEAPDLARFQPAWATRAHLLARSDRPTEAHTAYTRALTLTTDPHLRTALHHHQSTLPH